MTQSRTSLNATITPLNLTRLHRTMLVTNGEELTRSMSCLEYSEIHPASPGADDFHPKQIPALDYSSSKPSGNGSLTSSAPQTPDILTLGCRSLDSLKKPYLQHIAFLLHLTSLISPARPQVPVFFSSPENTGFPPRHWTNQLMLDGRYPASTTTGLTDTEVGAPLRCAVNLQPPSTR